MFHGVIQKIKLAQFFFETRCIYTTVLISATNYQNFEKVPIQESMKTYPFFSTQASLLRYSTYVQSIISFTVLLHSFHSINEVIKSTAWRASSDITTYCRWCDQSQQHRTLCHDVFLVCTVPSALTASVDQHSTLLLLTSLSSLHKQGSFVTGVLSAASAANLVMLWRIYA